MVRQMPRGTGCKQYDFSLGGTCQPQFSVCTGLFVSTHLNLGQEILNDEGNAISKKFNAELFSRETHSLRSSHLLGRVALALLHKTQAYTSFPSITVIHHAKLKVICV